VFPRRHKRQQVEEAGIRKLVGSSHTPSSKKDRRAKLQATRARQQSAERRRTLLFVGIAAVLALGIIAVAAIPALQNFLHERSIRSKPVNVFGVPAAQADCDPVIDDKASGAANHVPSGRVEYATVPASSGPHRPLWAPRHIPFYNPQDVPELETLVHNLEHGYLLAWYDDTITGDQLRDLQDLAKKIAETDKFIVAPWDNSRGEFPAGMHVALSRWIGGTEAHRQFCGKVSGEVIAEFMTRYPLSLEGQGSGAPEPFGA